MLLLAACLVAGFGITYLSQVELNLEERIAFGTVLGAMAVATVSFVLSMAVRDVTLFTVLIAMLATTAVALAILVLNRTQLAADLGDARARWTGSTRATSTSGATGPRTCPSPARSLTATTSHPTSRSIRGTTWATRS